MTDEQQKQALFPAQAGVILEQYLTNLIYLPVPRASGGDPC